MIYTLTSVNLGKNNQIDHRVWGWFPTQGHANEAVEKNSCDMNEGFWSYLVMEEIQKGVHGQSKATGWYKWGKDKWEKLDAPPAATLKSVVNIAMG
jgi:hypothetical protein